VLKCGLAVSSMTGSGFAWGIASNAAVSVTGVTSGISVTPTIIPSTGQVQTIGNGSLLASIDPSTPPATAINPGATNIEVLRIKLSAQNEDMRLQRLALTGAMTDLSSISVYDGTTQIGSVGVLNPSVNSIYLSNPLIIPKGSSKVLSVRVNVFSTAQITRVIQIGLFEASAAGVSSGLLTTAPGGQLGNPFTVTSIVTPPPPTPITTLNPDHSSLSFSTNVGNSAIPSQILHFNPVPNQLVYWQAASSASWLSLGSSSGSGYGGLTTWVNSTVASLSPGTYTATISLTPRSDSPVPFATVNVPVTLTVIPSPPTPITPPTPTPATPPPPITASPTSITVLSPNGGETWTRGTNQTITWTGGTNASTVNIQIDDQNGVGGYLIAQDVPNTGSYTFSSFKDVYGGSFPNSTYKIKIYKYMSTYPQYYITGNGAAPFTITGTVAATGVGDQNLANTLSSIQTLLESMGKLLR
jgi:hypothetical protein